MGIVLDVESSGLNPRSDHLRCVGYESNGKIIVDSLQNRSDGWGLSRYIPPGDVLIGANVHFDVQWFLRDRQLPNILTEDVQFLHYLLDESYPIRGLKHLFLIYTNYEDYEPSKPPHALSDEELYPYNALDVAATRLVYEGVIRELDSLGVRYHDTLKLMSRVQPILAAMEFTGIPVNAEKLDEIIQRESEEITRLEAAVREYCGELNLNSPQQLSKYIYEDLGCKVPNLKDARNKDGTPSTRKDIITAIDDDSGFIDTLLEFKGRRDNYKKYVLNIKERLEPNGEGTRVHPSYHTYKTAYTGGTSTGRLSVNNPPIHNIPRGHDMRLAFVPFVDSGYLIQEDLSQIELVGLAYQSQDIELIDAITTGEDLHTWMANKAAEYKYPISRQDAKVVNYGVLYGISAKGLMEQTSIRNIQAARDIISLWYDRFSGVRAWQEDIEEQAWRMGYVETEYGRRRSFPPFTKRSKEGYSYLREAKNFPIQAWASDINLLILADTSDIIKEDYPDVFPLTVIHDAIIWSADTEAAMSHWLTELDLYFRYDLMDSIKENLGMDLNVPISAEVKVGKNWLEMEEVSKLKADIWTG